MNTKIKDYLFLVLWIAILLIISFLIGFFSKDNIFTWYAKLKTSSLTPPNYVFPLAWSILYLVIGIFGWASWAFYSFKETWKINALYIIQLILNWSWTPVFFSYHMIGHALGIILTIDAFVSLLIYESRKKMKLEWILLIPYLLWLLFATYLNFYIWQNN